MPTRKANAMWEGGLKNGKGSFKGETGLGGQYSFNSRFENGAGSNPEELLSAAEAACFSMALAVGLEQAGLHPTKIETEAATTLDRVGDAFRITKIQLSVRAQVPNLDDAKFQQIAKTTKENCPVSVALKNVPIELDAKLA